MGVKFKEFLNELKNVKTIGLTCNAANVFEKLFWAIIGILGIAWGFYFIPSNVEVWVTNPSIITRSDLNLSQIKYPAITIKPSGINKYSIAERFINYLKPENLPIQLRQIRTLLVKCATLKNQENELQSDRYYYTKFQNDCIYKFDLKGKDKALCEVLDLSTTLLYSRAGSVPEFFGSGSDFGYTFGFGSDRFY